MTEYSEFAGMTTNERLFAAGLLDAFDEAARARDRDRMISLLRQVAVDESQASSIADTVLKEPGRYRF